MLQSLLADLEVMRAFTRSSGRGGGGGGGSNLPLLSTSLPNVRWEDVGGLESTRTEIMDAVELPLKYPTSFEDSRRSGILFGCELSTRTVFFLFFHTQLQADDTHQQESSWHREDTCCEGSCRRMWPAFSFGQRTRTTWFLS